MVDDFEIWVLMKDFHKVETVVYRKIAIKLMGLGFTAPVELEGLAEADTSAITTDATESAVVA